MRLRVIPILSLIFALALVGCESPEADDGADDQAAEAESNPIAQEDTPAEGDEAEEAEEAAEPSGPRVQETTTVSDEDLGTHPDGVGLEVGSALPALTLDTAMSDKAVDLEALADESALMIVFYRGGWCPYCNFQIRELTTSYDEFSGRGVELATVSVDQVDEATKTQEAYEIPFHVFSDPELEAHEAFNVVYEAEEEEVERLAEMGMDLEASSGQDHHSYAIPAVFLIVDGEVAWSHADLDYQRRPSIDQLLSAIDETVAN